MDSKLSLENITMLLQAVDKIRNVRNPELRGQDALSVSPGKLSTIQETMQIVSGYIPENHRLPFNNALKLCTRYCGTYCSLKKHLREISGQTPDIGHVLSTLKAVMPMLENQKKVPLRKVVSILEAMRN